MKWKWIILIGVAATTWGILDWVYYIVNTTEYPFESSLFIVAGITSITVGRINND